MAPHRKKDLAARRRRVDDEGDDEGGLEADLDDDSSEGSILSEEGEPEDGDGERVNKSEATASPQLAKVNGKARREPDTLPADTSKATPTTKPTNGTSDMDLMLNGLKISEQAGTNDSVQYEDLRDDPDLQIPSPAVVKSSAAMDQPQEAPYERRRREHEEYKKRRDADPSFVPNRGAFFMHDHRHSGPAANGFRPFGRGRGRGRPGIGGPYAPSNLVPQPLEPTDAPWAHDMHEVISEPNRRSQPQYADGFVTLPARVPTSTSKAAPPNRSLSTEKHIGNVQLRVFLVNMEKPHVFPAVALKQYTRLPDHRPPLRRDKPVRISLPDHPPRYIFPAVDRSFIFIPRAMRPNQQGFGGRGKGRSGLGSIGGYSRRTSVFGGSVYGGSTYAPSVAQSRRSSLAREVLREVVLSPTNSTISRPPMAMDTSKPIVKLPPTSQSVQPRQMSASITESIGPLESAIVDDVPRPQAYPPPQKPTLRENRPAPIPMHQPRPQKAVSISDIESPATSSFYPPPQQQQQPFHQQVPVQVNGNPYSEGSVHSRNPSYLGQPSARTPLSQIPERAIHAQPFQPTHYQQPSQGYYPPPYSVLAAPAQGYYYPQNMSAMSQTFMPGHPQQPQQYQQVPQQSEAMASQGGVQSLVAQEVNGMVYYYDAAQLPSVAAFPTYQQPAQAYPIQQAGLVHQGMGGMMTPSPDGFYYPQGNQGVAYYPQ